VMGPYKGLKEARRVVIDCMNNVHPIYHIKELMIKRELAKDPELKDQSWDRFLPQFKRRTLSKRKKPFKVTDKSKKVYTPFPPPQEKSKVDLQIESGEYFLGKYAKERKEKEAREENMKEKMEAKKKEREKDFVPPTEAGADKERKRKKALYDGTEEKKPKKKKKREEKLPTTEEVSAEKVKKRRKDAVEGEEKPKKKKRKHADGD